MATVYLAVQEVFEREVALKVMSRALADDPNFSQRFFREAKIVSQLVHPNIVTVHDVGMHDGYCYLSMEYIDGHDLKQMVDQLNLRQKIIAIRDIAKALDYAGSKGYVHRDIKPENIMFHSSDGRAVLLDFGIARAVESEISVTQTGIAIGTPHYMSPEQAKGKPVDFRSDIYSLGVVLYYVLCGHVPYDADSAVAIGIKHITDPIPRLPDVYAGLQPILDRMMAKSVTHRYQSAKALIADIDHLDLEVLEHQFEFARVSLRRAGDSSVTSNTPTLERAKSVQDVDASVDPVAQSRAFENYALESESYASERGPILPWFLSGMFVVTVILGFIYFKNPALFRPWMDEGFKLFDDYTQKVVQWSEKDELASGARLAESSQPIIRSLPATAETPLITPVPARNKRPQEHSTLQDKVRQLEKSYAGDAIYLNDLIAVYRELIARTADPSELMAKFEQVKHAEFEKLLAQARENGSSEKLSAKVEQMRMLFPEEKKGRFDHILSIAESRKYVLTQIVEAEAYLRQNNLTLPKGRNALNSYQKALQRDPKNSVALAGLRTISQRLYEQAQARYQANQVKQSLRLAKKAIEVNSGNQPAKKLLATIEAEQSPARQISTLLSAAKTKLDKGDLFTPENHAAFFDYQAVLKLDPSNRTAKEGLGKVVDALSVKVWQLIGDKQFEQARALMNVAKKNYGENEQVKSLALAVDQVAENKNADKRR